MSNRVVLRQVMIVMIIFSCIIVMNHFQTPWSNDFENCLKYILAEDSGLSLQNLNDLNRMGINIDIEKWKTNLSTSIQSKFKSLSAYFREKINTFMSRWHR